MANEIQYFIPDEKLQSFLPDYGNKGYTIDETEICIKTLLRANGVDVSCLKLKGSKPTNAVNDYALSVVGIRTTIVGISGRLFTFENAFEAFYDEHFDLN